MISGSIISIIWSYSDSLIVILPLKKLEIEDISKLLMLCAFCYDKVERLALNISPRVIAG